MAPNCAPNSSYRTPRNEASLWGRLRAGCNVRYCRTDPPSGEIRPIIGGRLGSVDLIVDPILDTSFQGLGALDFEPASRVAYHFSETRAAALEHYADYGRLNKLEPLGRQQQLPFAVVDYKSTPLNVEFGIGHGFTAASDRLVLKADPVAPFFEAAQCSLNRRRSRPARPRRPASAQSLR
jgi:hypothetical protein